MTTAIIKPQWSPLTIALMVMGFIIFWPLGLAVLGYARAEISYQQLVDAGVWIATVYGAAEAGTDAARSLGAPRLRA